MKSNELFEKIHSGIIKNGTDIKVMYKNEEVDNIKYEAGMLQWEQGGKFSSKYLCDIETEFEIIEEEQQDIDIQNIEDIDKDWTYIEGLVEKTWSVAELEIIENLNKLVQAVKQLDKQINLQSSKETK